MQFCYNNQLRKASFSGVMHARPIPQGSPELEAFFITGGKV